MPGPTPPLVPDLDPATISAMRVHLAREMTAGVDPGRHRTWLVASVAAVVALIAGTVLGLNLAGNGTEPAGDARTLYPEPVTAAQRSEFEALCRNDDGWNQPGGPDSRAWIRTAKLVALDRHGKYYSVILAAGNKYATCLGEAGNASLPSYDTSFGGPRTADLTRPEGAEITSVVSINSESGDPKNPRRTAFLAGRAGPDVAAISIHLHGGARSVATLTPGGWWQAQFPDFDSMSRTPTYFTADVTDRNGHTHQERLRY